MILSDSIGLLTTTWKELQELYNKQQQQQQQQQQIAGPVLPSASPRKSSSSSFLESFVPLHPEMKLSPELREYFTEKPLPCHADEEGKWTIKSLHPKNNNNNNNNNNPVVNLRFKIHALSSAAELESFQQTLASQILNLYNGVVTFKPLNPSSLLDASSSSTFHYIEGQPYQGILTIADCYIVGNILPILASLTEIYWIETDYPVYTHNRYSKGICDSGIDGVTPLPDHNITGLGEVIAISDTGIDMKHCFFYDPNVSTPYNTINHKHRKVVQYLTTNGDGLDTSEGHGTHVAGSAAGLGYYNYGDYKKFSGMAHDAKIAFADLFAGDTTNSAGSLSTGNIYTLFNTMYSSGARIFTNSWGTKNNVYDSSSSDVDKFMWLNPDALVLFSAGNQGTDPLSGVIKTDSVSSPSTNKNGISVGASLNSHNAWKAVSQGSVAEAFSEISVAYFSSEGATSDKRLKPDILAPGYYVFSSKGYYNASSYHCDSQGLDGTSMSSPTMAGFAVLVRQFYNLGYYPSGSQNSAHAFTPAGALIKATLVHSGQPMKYFVKKDDSYFYISSTYPSIVQGYGRIQLNKVLNFNSKSTHSPLSLYVKGGATPSDAYYVALSTTGQVHTYNFSTSASSTQSPIRVTLCYTDYYADPVNQNIMINTLTLSIQSSLGATFTPYLPDGSDGKSLIQSNTQVIDIPNPTPSTTYTMTITATKINNGPQPYAFVATGELTYYNLTSSSTNTAVDTSNKPHLSFDMTVYIVVLAILAGFFIICVYWFYRLASASAINNAKNYALNDDEIDFEILEDGEDNPKKQTTYQRLFGSNNNNKKSSSKNSSSKGSGSKRSKSPGKSPPNSGKTSPKDKSSTSRR